MTLLQLLILAIIQGVTEFLPISSSGHLILVPVLSGWQDQGLLIDVAVHVGTLAAILVYFLRDTMALARGGMSLVGIGTARQERRWLLWIIAGTIPAAVVGLVFKTFDIPALFRSPDLVATTLIVYGVLLYIADRIGPQRRRYEEMTLKDAIIVGCAQALALIPGTSRSGVTMTAARLLGFTRPEAARFSFILGIPAIAGAGLLVGLDLAEADPALRRDAIIAGLMTFVAALGAMAFLMRWLERASMTVFVVYRILLGLAILAFV